MRTTNRGAFALLGLVVCACVGSGQTMAANAPTQNLFYSAIYSYSVGEVTPDGASSIYNSGSELVYPLGLAFDSEGNLFVGNESASGPDTGYITKITPSGDQSLFATGLRPGGLAFNKAGDLFAANDSDITEYTPSGVPSTFASGLNTAAGIVFDKAGDLFVANGFGNAPTGTVTKITPTGVESTFAFGLPSYPLDLAIDSADDVFVSYGFGSDTITKITPGGAQSTFASLPDAAFFGLACDSAGDLFAGDYNSPTTIDEFSPEGSQSIFCSSVIAGPPSYLTFQPASVVPEPSAWTLLAGAPFTLQILSRRKRVGW